jgi:hypothetical protein
MITLKLTRLQAKGLLACAGDGAEGLLTDETAAKAYVGGPKAQQAAEEALQLLRSAVHGKAERG